MVLTTADIYIYMKDLPEFNVLLEGDQQSSNELVRLAMRLALSDFNSVEPVTVYTLENFPQEAILLYGTLHHLAISEAEKQLRNQVNYSAQGLNAGIDDKMPQYNQLANFYKGLFDSKTQQYKHYINEADAWGEIFSPYHAIHETSFRS